MEQATLPARVQLSRIAGWRMPSNTVKVSRPSKFGNPFIVGEHGTQAEWVEQFKGLESQLKETARRELTGKNLACWCKPGTPCHADVLLAWCE